MADFQKWKDELSMKLHIPDDVAEKAAFLHRKRVEFNKDIDLSDTAIYELHPAYLYVAHRDHAKTPLDLDELVKVSNVSKEKIIANAEIILEECQQIKKWKILVSPEEFELFADKKNIEIKDNSLPEAEWTEEKCPRCAKGRIFRQIKSGEMFCSKCGFELKKDL
jgi:transcription initiation factor TFIIIB Brf1 subunit/transcription initiation factor TFIIB